MQVHLLFLTIIAAVLVTACGDYVTPTPKLEPQIDLHPALGEPFTLHPSDSALLETGEKRYRFDLKKVLADSRCPAGTECLRPNIAIIEIALTSLGLEGRAESYELFFDPGPSEGVVGPFTVQILAITPDVEHVESSFDYAISLLVTATPTDANLDVHMTSTASIAAVGDSVTYGASAAGLAHAQYTLSVNGAVVGITRHDGTLTRSSQTPVIELVGWSADSTNASWTIQVLTPGVFVMEASILAHDGGGHGSQSVAGTGRAALTIAGE
jgi:hypothetical protein